MFIFAGLTLQDLGECWTPSGLHELNGIVLPKLDAKICRPHRRRQTDDAKIISPNDRPKGELTKVI